MAMSHAQQQTLESLRSQFDKCIECLNDLVALHQEIDPPNRTIESTDDECCLRLRKVLLHVQAITAWQYDTEILHVIAPEIRCANKQLEKVLKFIPESYRASDLGKDGSVAGQISQPGGKLREIISGFVHPTPARFFLPIERGGFCETNETRSLLFPVMMLADLAVNYEASVAYLCKESMAGNAPEVTPVFGKIVSIAAAFGDMPLDQIFNAGEWVSTLAAREVRGA